MRQETDTIICKPTHWFALRALAMLVMFGVFSVLFYKDGTTGYRKKNLEYHLNAAFMEAGEAFKKMKSAGELSPEAWKEFAEKQTVKLPGDASLLPAGTKIPLPWPAVLADFAKMEPGQPHLLWQEYSGLNRMSEKVAEKPYDAAKIGEQIVVFYICLSLTLVTLFFLIRTMRRTVVADDNALTTACGKRIPYADMRRLDLRKWDTKGIAFIDFETPEGSRRARIDGLTYGGFKAENGEPAERLMGRIRSNFSGEIIEYAAVTAEEGVPTRDGDG